MSAKTINDLDALTAATVATDDQMVLWDTSGAVSKKLPADAGLQALLNTTATGLSPTVVTPTALSGNTDNWAAATGVTNRVSASAAYNLTGIVAEGSGSIKFLWNVGTFPITLVNAATSTAANQFTCVGGANIVLGPSELAMLTYSTTTSRWLTCKVVSSYVTGGMRFFNPAAPAEYLDITKAGTSASVTNVGNGGALVLATNANGSIVGALAGLYKLFLTASRLAIPSDYQFAFSSNTNADGAQDTGLKRDAAGVVAATNGSTGTGWVQNSAGSKRVATTVTNATVTMSNVTDVSFTTIAGRKYAGKIGVFCSNTTAANGIKFDMDGGTSTWTSFRGAICSNIQGATLGTTIGTAIATDLTATAMNGTGDHYVEIVFSGVANAAGTCILRFAENSTGGGLASVLANSFELADDVP